MRGFYRQTGMGPRGYHALALSLEGSVLGIYRVGRELGRGGMGTVYRAESTAAGAAGPAGAVVALKVFHPELVADERAFARFRLEAARCKACSAVTYPVRLVCSKCGGKELEQTELSRKGKVVTSTVVHVAPSDFLMETPYAMAVVETPEGARLMLQVADCDPAEVLPGMDVEFEFRKIRKEGSGGILCYGYKAIPASAS